MTTSFKEFLGESSLSRVYNHTKERNIGMISASRGERTHAENEALHKDLGHKIRKAGYGMINVRGRYIENYGKEDARPVDEKSYLVVGKKGHDHGQLLSHLKGWGAEYNQDSILHKAHDSSTAALHGTKEGGYPGAGKSEEVGPWHPNRAAEFLTVLKKKKSGDHSFAFMEQVEFTSEKSFFSREEMVF